MPDPHVSLSGGSFTISGYAPQWSIGNLGQIRLADHFQITPQGSLSDPQIKLGLHLIDLTWGHKGHLWLEQSLTAGATFHLLQSGAAGSLQLNNQLLWAPAKDLQFFFTFTLTGQLDQHGFSGSVNFGSQYKWSAPKSTVTGLGLGVHF
jgi:hypothetical protein